MNGIQYMGPEYKFKTSTDVNTAILDDSTDKIITGSNINYEKFAEMARNHTTQQHMVQQHIPNQYLPNQHIPNQHLPNVYIPNQHIINHQILQQQIINSQLSQKRPTSIATNIQFPLPNGKKYYYIPLVSQVGKNILFKSFEIRSYNELIITTDQIGNIIPILVKKDEHIPVWIVCSPIDFSNWIVSNKIN